MPSAAELVEIDRKVFIAGKVCALAARVLPPWPRLNLDNIPRVSGPGRAAAGKPSILHEWSWYRSFWRCQRCLKSSWQEHMPHAAGCSGVLPDLALDIGRLDHHLQVFSCSDGTLLYACVPKLAGPNHRFCLAAAVFGPERGVSGSGLIPFLPPVATATQSTCAPIVRCCRPLPRPPRPPPPPPLPPPFPPLPGPGAIASFCLLCPVHRYASRGHSPQFSSAPSAPPLPPLAHPH